MKIKRLYERHLQEKAQEELQQEFICFYSAKHVILLIHHNDYTVSWSFLLWVNPQFKIM